MNDFKQYLSTEKVVQQLESIQIFIDVKTKELEGFRKLPVNDFTLNEIRILEGKLIKCFGEQLEVKKYADPNNCLPELKHYPSVTKLLIVIGVSTTLIEVLQKRSESVKDLLGLSNMQLQSIISNVDGHSDDTRKLSTALSLLKRLQDAQGKGIADTELYWDSWSKMSKSSDDRSNLINQQFNSGLSTVENGIDNQSTGRSRNGSESSSSFLSEENNFTRIRYNTDPSTVDGGEDIDSQRNNFHQQIPSTSSSCITPPSPIRGSRSSLEDSAFLSRDSRVQQGSPPPRIAMVVTPSMSTSSTVQTPPVTPGTPHKNLHRLTSTSDYSSHSRSLTRNRVSSTGARATYNTLMPAFNKLKPSKSSEFHIGNHILPAESMSASNQSLTSIATLPPPSSTKSTFSKQKKQKKRPKDLVLTESNVPNYINLLGTASRRSSTTVSPEGILVSNTSPLSPRTPMTPSTPCNIELLARDRDIATNYIHSPLTPKTPKANLKSFRKLVKKKIGKKLKRSKSNDQVIDDNQLLSTAHSDLSRRCSDTLPPDNFQHPSASTHSSSIPVRDMSPINSTPPVSLVDTDKTITDPLGASETERATQSEADEEDVSDQDSTLKDESDVANVANLFRQPSMMHSEEWDIPYDQLEFSEKIGCGRVGTVHKGYWHGDVAIRVITISHNDEEKLRAFKQEIMIYKKTRHENLELFMGSCMDPPRLAIVTGFCQGKSLFNYIRDNKSQAVNFNSAKIIAQHIVQGMGYLHSKGIIHKDLKSKNIFVFGKRVVITDFGLVGLHALCSDTRSTSSKELMIPDGWLCYLAPEVIKNLRCPISDEDDVISTLNYSTKSDVYAFGTVWYELLSGSWPFKGYSAESIIWQAGSGKKQNLSQLQGGKDVKDILMQCWAFAPIHRPDFSDKGIMGSLKKLQSQIVRSLSSHPRRGNVNRGISHERLFDATPLGPTPFSTMHDLAEYKGPRRMSSVTNSLPRPAYWRHQRLKTIPFSLSSTLGSSLKF